MNTRRNFIKDIGLSSLAMGSFPLIINVGEHSVIDNKEKTRNEMVFLFQGDSITDGNRGRNNDPNHIMGHGYAFSIASRLGADYPEKRLAFYNRGVSGDKVSELAARWQKDTLELKPNVLSILIGVNDVLYEINNGIAATDQFEETYQSLIDQTKNLFPEILFVLCQPFILPVGNVKEKWDLWQAEMKKKQTIVHKLSKKNNAIYLEFQDVFNEACKKAPADYWIWDGIHPTVAGHELIAREWIRMVSKRLSF